MNDIFIRGIKLPPRVRGVTVIDDNSDFNVYINTLLSYETQRKAKKHELMHILKDHFYDSEPVIYNEMEANAG